MLQETGIQFPSCEKEMLCEWDKPQAAVRFGEEICEGKSKFLEKEYFYR